MNVESPRNVFLSMLPLVISGVIALSFIVGYMLTAVYDSAFHIIVALMAIPALIVTAVFSMVIWINDRRICGYRKTSLAGMIVSVTLLLVMIAVMGGEVFSTVSNERKHLNRSLESSSNGYGKNFAEQVAAFDR